jgi:dUTP pyrophosphatase
VGKLKLKIKVLGEHLADDGTVIDPTPRKGSSRAAGLDLKSVQQVVVPEMSVSTVTGRVKPGKAEVRCGFAMEVPPGYEGQVRPRSGIATKHLVIIPNAPGTIDEDYRGEVKVHFINLSGDPFVIKAGDRIAQLLIKRVEDVEVERTEELSGTERGEGGFGSTGK